MNRNSRRGRRKVIEFEPNFKLLNLIQPLDDKELDSLKKPS